MAKQTWVNVGGVWKKIKSAWVNVGGVWKKDVMPKGVVSGNWKEFMSYYVPYVYSNSPSKFNINGEIIWSYDAYKASAVTTDLDGNVISAMTDGNIALRKYDVEGNLLWTSNIDSGYAYSISIDSNGDIFVIRASNRNTVSKVGGIDGGIIWNAGVTLAGIVRLDYLGNAYVTQDSSYSTNSLWKITVNGSISQIFSISGKLQSLLVDNEGYIYVKTSTNEIIKLDSNGSEVWRIPVENYYFYLGSADYDYIYAFSQADVSGGSLIYKIDKNGIITEQIQTNFPTAESLDILPDGTIFMCSVVNKKIGKLDSEGNVELEMPDNNIERNIYDYTSILSVGKGRIGSYPDQW